MESIKDASKMGKLVGKGTYGKVYLQEINVLGKRTNTKCAVKIIEMSKLSSNERLEVIKEVNTMANLQHQNIVKLICRQEQRDSIRVVMEYCQYSLHQYIQEGKLQRTNVDVLFRQILKGYQYLLSKNIVHRDLKPENILIKIIPGMTPVIKLADFGCSKKLKYNSQMLNSVVGTPLYCAPQILQGANKYYQEGTEYSKKCDIWSLGVIYYQMLTGNPPWELSKNSVNYLTASIHKTVSEWNTNSHIQNYYFPKLKINDLQKMLIKRMLTIEQKDRISWKELFDQFFIGEKTGYTVVKNLNNLPKEGKQNKYESPSKQNSKRSENINMKANNTYKYADQNQRLLNKNNNGPLNVPKPKQAAKQSKVPALRTYNGKLI